MSSVFSLMLFSCLTDRFSRSLAKPTRPKMLRSRREWSTSTNNMWERSCCMATSNYLLLTVNNSWAQHKAKYYLASLQGFVKQSESGVYKGSLGNVVNVWGAVLRLLRLTLVPTQLAVFDFVFWASFFMFHPQAEGSKLQRDLRAYLEAVKGDTHTLKLTQIQMCMCQDAQIVHDKMTHTSTCRHPLIVMVSVCFVLSHARVLQERAGVFGRHVRARLVRQERSGLHRGGQERLWWLCLDQMHVWECGGVTLSQCVWADWVVVYMLMQHISYFSSSAHVCD